MYTANDQHFTNFMDAILAADIAKALDAGKGVLYTRWFWRYIMLIIIHIPDRIFRKMSM